MVIPRSIKLLFLCSFFTQHSNARIIGSDAILSIEPLAILSSSDSDNSLQTFGWLKNGFVLADANTTCTFKSVFPVSGSVALNGGQLWLNNNLVLSNVSTMTSNGTILGNNYALDLASSVTWWSRVQPMIFDNINIFLNNDLHITGTVEFTGECVFDARNHRIKLDPGAVLTLQAKSKITLRNLELYGVNNCTLNSVDDSVVLVLDNMRFVQNDNIEFTKGSILFSNEVNFCGSKKFSYASSLTSTIMTDSVWYLSDISTLRIGRKNSTSDREPLYFEDTTAILRMENSTLSITSSGICLTKGSFVGDGQVKLEMDSTNIDGALQVGNGIEADNFYFTLYPEAVLNLVKGHYVYNGIGQSSFVNDEVGIKFVKKNAGSYFIAKQDLKFKDVVLKASPASSTTAVEGKKIYFDNVLIQASVVDYLITATRINEYVDLLAGNGLLEIHFGRYPLSVQVLGTGNRIGGIGSISGQIMLLDAATELTMDFHGKIDNNITMADSKLILTGDLLFDREAKIIGAGQVESDGYDVLLDLNGKDWTSTVTWITTDSVLNLVSDMNLQSCLTFNGDWIIDGNGKTLSLDTAGSIVVGSGSSLYFKNVNISGNKLQKIRCIDHSGSINFDNASMYLASDYIFNKGSLGFYNEVDFFGDATFSYESSITSTIHRRAMVTMRPGTNLKIGRADGYIGREPLYFDDRSSILRLDNCTLTITSSGMQFTHGKLVLNRKVITDLQGTTFDGGAVFGDGTADGDIEVEWMAGASLDLLTGRVIYNCTNPNFFIAKAKNSRIAVGSAFKLWMKDSIHIKNLAIDSTFGFEVIVDPGKESSYENYQIFFGDTVHEVTGKYYDNYTHWLYGNCNIIVSTGSLPNAVLVTGSNNWLSGTGNVGGPIILGDSSSELIISILGTFYTDITLNGGKLLLNKRLSMGPKKFIQGAGVIEQLSEMVFIDGRDTTWTGTITWDSSGGVVQLLSDMQLSSAWTFSQDCLLDGNGFALDLRDTGQLIVERGSSLRLKNITVKDISGNRVRCNDNAATLMLDNTDWVQSGDTAFATGELKILGVSGMFGYGTTFTFQSSEQSKISARAELTLHEGLIFSYDPPTTSRTLFTFSDSTSKLILDTSTLHSTSTGLQLIKGDLIVRGQCTLQSDAAYKAEGVIFGDGVSADNDLDITIYPASRLEIVSGWVVDKNVN